MALLFTLPANAWVPDEDAQLEAGDNPCQPVSHLGRPAMAFDDGANEEACTSAEIEMPAFTGALTMKVAYAMASDTTNDIDLGGYVEAKTLGTDTLDMEAAESFDSANTATASVSGTTAGDPLELSITLTNKDSVAEGDAVRFGLRRNTQAAGDDAVGDLFMYYVSIHDAS